MKTEHCTVSVPLYADFVGLGPLTPGDMANRRGGLGKRVCYEKFQWSAGTDAKISRTDGNQVSRWATEGRNKRQPAPGSSVQRATEAYSRIPCR